MTQSIDKINQKSASNRRKFIGATTLLSAMAVIAGIFKRPVLKAKVTCDGDTVTMLTQDGKLVYVHSAVLNARRAKVTDNELQNWMKTN